MANMNRAYICMSPKTNYDIHTIWKGKAMKNYNAVRVLVLGCHGGGVRPPLRGCFNPWDASGGSSFGSLTALNSKG